MKPHSRLEQLYRQPLYRLNHKGCCP